MQTRRRETLHKSERLCSERRIDVLFGRGRRGSEGPLRFCFIAADDGKPTAREESEARAGTAVSEEAVRSGDGAAVSVLFSVPKKAFKKAWKRNLIKRRMRESYRRRKHALADAARARGHRIDVALICMPSPEIPDFATIDNAIAKILDKILARS